MNRMNRIKNRFRKENSALHPVHLVHPVKTLFSVLSASAGQNLVGIA